VIARVAIRKLWERLDDRAMNCSRKELFLATPAAAYHSKFRVPKPGMRGAERISFGLNTDR
jgi:hypothetical protein